MAQLLSAVTPGTLVKLNENGSPVEFYVAKHDYESGLNGTGKTLLVRKDLYSSMSWNTTNRNSYNGSSIDTWLNGEYKNMLDADIRALILGTEIRITLGGGVSSVGNTNRSVFLLSTTELGVPQEFYMNVEGTELIIADTLKKSNSGQLTRSPDIGGSTHFWLANNMGNGYSAPASSKYPFRPVFTLPALQVFVSEDGTLSPNSAPSTPASINIPDIVFLGAPVSVSWSAASDPNGNLSGYELQRSINDSGWVQVYKGTNTSYKDTLPGNTTKVQYRVKAYDDILAGSDWRLSSTATVYGPPAISNIHVAMQGQPINVTWSAVDVADSYLLQRKADGGEWEQVYAGADLTYTDTAGAWSTVQYQVCGVFAGVNGAFAQSEVITVLPASTLAISGSDGDLGTITSDIPYSVTDTGNQISLTRTVNGVLVASLTVDGGFAYSIPVMDLPTGTGTIVITATGQTSSGPVTVARTWTYTKQAQTFPGSGGLAQLAQDGQNMFPLTLAEAVKTIGGPWGGNLSTALDKLAMAATYRKTALPKYTEVNVDLSKVQAGDVVSLPENGVMVPFYVASLNYEPTLNTGGARALLVRKTVYQNDKWNSTNVNAYANSTIDNWLNNTYKPMLDSTVLSEIGTTTFYYTPGNGNNGVTTLARSIFIMSLTELGFVEPYANIEGSQLPAYNLLQQNVGGENGTQWTRSPRKDNQTDSWRVVSGAVAYPLSSHDKQGYRPCFTLPATFQATYYVDPNSGTVRPSQEYTTAGDFADLWGNIIPTVKIETGSYVGTGTTGSGTPNEITAPFPPKLAIIYGNPQNIKTAPIGVFICSSGAYSVNYINSSSAAVGGKGEISVAGNTMKWWATSITAGAGYDNVQFNVSGVKYNWFIFG